MAHSAHLENLARGLALSAPGSPLARNIRAICRPIYPARSTPKSISRTPQPDHKKAVVRALCLSFGPDAANLHGILEWLTQFEGLIQNQQYLPYARFKLLPYFARQEEQTKAA